MHMMLRGSRLIATMLLVLGLSACAAGGTPTPGAPPTARVVAVAPAETSLPVAPAQAQPEPGQTPPLPSPLPVLPTATRFSLPGASPTLAPTALPLQPTATPNCVNSLRFVSDLTVPDGAIVQAGELVDKRWQVENNGTCNWDARYRLRRLSGPALGMPDEQALYPARSGAAALIRMLLQAPGDPGTYRSAWQAIDPLGEPFGDPIFVEFIIN